jgi:hypothetical protein
MTTNARHRKGKQNSALIAVGTIFASISVLILTQSPVMAAWKEKTSKNCYRICEWKGAIVQCKGAFGIPYPCHQWQKRCGEERCHRTSH